MKCLIIAAGGGSRLRERAECKPLIPILGIPLIERVIRTAFDAGADEFYVVTGYEGDRLRAFLTGLAQRLAIRITPLLNGAWEKENGLSILKAQESLREPFLLLMADHLFDPHLARMLMAHAVPDGEIALGVDGDTRNPLVDMEDVTRVKVESGRVRGIGKGLADFTGFDTGVFLCSPAIFRALEESSKADGDTTLSGGVRVLAAEGRVKAVPVRDFWIDVDDPATFKEAEKALLDRVRGKSNDGPVSRYVNRPISVLFSRHLAKLDVSPNQISLFSFLCSLLAAGLFALGGYLALLLGGVTAQLASIIDGCDGEVARLKYQSSDFGGWFDAVLDRYADAFLLFGLTWHLFAAEASGWVLFAGFMAIIGSFMLSYTADKYDNLMRQRITGGGRAGLRMGRDVRVFLVFLGATLNLVLPALVVIGVLMNLETLRRIKAARAMRGVDSAKQRIRRVIAGSRVPEDPRHADNTLEWLLRLEPDADEALQLAALAHDIDRADEERKVRRAVFDDYDAFKAAHARNGAAILRPILTACGVERHIVSEACRLVEVHEVGGDPRSDLLKDADGVSFFDVSLPLYGRREGWAEARRRSRWGYARLSPRAREIVMEIGYEDEALVRLLQEVSHAPPAVLSAPSSAEGRPGLLQALKP
jgi:CDP-L-myo-inositol myo-inositolphosphotransferase